MTSAPAPARAAATVVLLRDGEGDGGPEVCLLRRHARSAFMPDAWVFPGGTVDDGDRRLDPAAWTGGDPDHLAARLAADPETALGLSVAAVRETFEEAGVLLARDATGAPVRPAALDAAGLAAARRGEDFSGWLTAEGLRLDLGALVAWRRWVTPTSEPRRYDTVFFVARAPQGQEAASDRRETTGQRWLRPAEALDEAAAGRLSLVLPQQRSLAELAGATDVDAVLAEAAAAPAIRAVQPHVDRRPDGGVAVIHPDDPGFPADADAVAGAW